MRANLNLPEAPAAGLLFVVAAVALAAAFAAAPGSARAAPVDDFNRARNAFTFGNYGDAIRLLSPLLKPLQLREETQIVEARQLLGVSHYFMRSFFAAQEEFERLLYLRPRHELDPLIFPPPVIEFFEKVRARIKDKLALLHPERRVEAAPVVLRHVEKHHLVLSFFPFGVGQFQNNKSTKAIFFLTSQLAMLATNLAAYGAAESRRLADGRFAAGDESLVKNLRTTQLVSLAALGALFIGGVVDAVIDFRPEIVREESVAPSQVPLPGATSPPGASPPPAGTATPRGRSSEAPRRLQWGPWFTTGGGGLALGFHF